MLVNYVAVMGYDAGWLPRWLTALAMATHIGTIPIVAPLAAGIDVEMDRVLIGAGLFVAAFLAINWALVRRAARRR